MQKKIILLLLGLQIICLSPVYALTINLNNIGGVVANSPAEAGFQKAATFWETWLTDDVTVNIDVGFNSLGAGVLGQASTSLVPTSYTNVRNAMIADVTSSFDVTAVNNLAAGATFDTFINRTSDSPNADLSVPYLDYDDGLNNSSIFMTVANARALGFSVAQGTTADGTINFSNNQVWDFDDGNGIDSGAFDFVGVAIHEIGHTLGFISGADQVDTGSSFFTSGKSDNDFLSSTLDLFRFSDLSAAAGVTDLSADSRDKYFSIDNGTTKLASFSTGVNFGDGRQASHWIDGQGVGIMDPTFAPGEFGLVTFEDVLAFDVIGWDVLSAVPEPVPFALFIMGLVVVIAHKRQRELRADA